MVVSQRKEKIVLRVILGRLCGEESWCEAFKDKDDYITEKLRRKSSPGGENKGIETH